jgi:hypothetical protein
MPSTQGPKLVAPGDAKTVQLCGRPDRRPGGGGTHRDLAGQAAGHPPRHVECRRRAGAGAGDPLARRPGGLLRGAGAGPPRARPAPEYYALAERYGLTIVDDWIEELERTYGVKL